MASIPAKQPPVNILSQGAGGMKNLLLDASTDLWIVSGAGVPASGEGNGWLGKGSLVIDTTNGDIYQNVGTLAATVFLPISVGAGGIQDGITAHAGGTKAAAFVLTKYLNRLSVVATNADSVLLPPAVPGAEVVVINDGAANAQVFGAGTDTIDGVATATGVVLTAAKRDIFYCLTAGAWQSLQGVKSV